MRERDRGRGGNGGEDKDKDKNSVFSRVIDKQWHAFFTSSPRPLQGLHKCRKYIMLTWVQSNCRSNTRILSINTMNT